MKILKWVFILGGIVLIGAAVFNLFYEPETDTNQIIGMIGLGILTLLGGIAIKKRK